VSQSMTALNAYHQVTTPTRTARGAEYEVVARITHRMRSATQQGKTAFPELVAALDENRRLWSAFAEDVASPKNALPQDVRARIAYLAEFTFGQTGKILAGKASAAPLIEINTAIMRGLRGQEPQK
jgi:flagellar biosynthesis activator protein FlaF